MTLYNVTVMAKPRRGGKRDRLILATSFFDEKKARDFYEHMQATFIAGRPSVVALRMMPDNGGLKTLATYNLIG